MQAIAGGLAFEPTTVPVKHEFTAPTYRTGEAGHAIKREKKNILRKNIFNVCQIKCFIYSLKLRLLLIRNNILSLYIYRVYCIELDWPRQLCYK